MPIRPENRARYPKDWVAIVAKVAERSGDRCEGSPAFPDCRAANREPHPETGSRVVLTTGHLDHTPENCASLNHTTEFFGWAAPRGMDTNPGRRNRRGVCA